MIIKKTAAYLKKTSGYETRGLIDSNEFPTRPGLEGPFRMRNGRVVYYDPREGKYYDSKSDVYLSDEESLELFEDMKSTMSTTAAKKRKMKGKDPCWDGYKMVGTRKKDGREVPNCVPKEASSRIATKKEHRSPAGGLNQKGRDYYNRENGSNLKAPVTEDNPTGKRKKRQDSYCARSEGQMKDHNIDCREDPDKPICKSRKRWNCN